MAPTRGMLLLDLIPDAPGAGLIPADIAERLGALAVLEYHATTTGHAYIYHGVLAPAGDLLEGFGLPGLRDWPVEIPGLNAGVPFQLVLKRRTPGPGENLEPAPTDWRLDLILDRVAIVIPGLRPAVRVEGSGTTAVHLIRDPEKEHVRIVGSGVFRIAMTAGKLDVRFIDRVDPFALDGETGPVFRLTFEPPHFFIGDLDFGLTVDRLTYDDSTTYTPPEIVARHHDATWRGIAINEATLYLPRNTPVIGDLSVGVRDVLLGSPAGLQGAIQVELGQTPVDPSAVSFFLDGQEEALTVDGTGETRSVRLPAGSDGRFRVRAVLNGGGTARWHLPGGRQETGAATSVFDARDGDTVTVQGLEVVDGETYLSTEVQFRFVEDTAEYPPQITVTDGADIWTNVLSVSGTAADLRRLTFGTQPARDDATWEFGTATATGATFTPAIPDDPGRYALVMRDARGRPRRVEVEVLARGGLLLGTQAGVRDQDGPVPVRAVEGTYLATPFHQAGERVAAGSDATVGGGAVTVPRGAFAAVTLEREVEPDGTDAPAPPRQTPPPLRHVQVRMEFARTDIIGWGESRPQSASGAVQTIPADVARWMEQFPDGTRFLMVGRTDDLGSGDLNVRLGRARAEALRDLVAPLLPADRGFTIVARGEQDPAGGDPVIDYAPEANRDVWLIREEAALPGDRQPGSYPRPRYRRVDVYAAVAADGAPDQETVPTGDDRLPELRRALVPGDDGAAPVRPAAGRRPTPYRARLVVEWDSPTVVDLADAIPTKAELLVAWQPQRVPVPGAPAPADIEGPRPEQPGGPSVFQLLIRWSYDARSGQTVVNVALDNQGSPDGLFAIPKEPGGTPGDAGNLLAVALGLGPALSAFLDAAGVDDGAARIAALLGAAAVATPFARKGRVVVHKVSAEQRQRSIASLAGFRLRALFDYTVQLGFEVDAGPIQIRAAKPMKVKYLNVGAEFDDSKEGLEKLGLVYEDASFEIVDPGQWAIEGPLGNLLRVNGVRSGSGSTWMELDLAFALDLGVIRISGATIRLTFAGGGLEVALRGLHASVTVPGALRGEGAMSLGEEGTLSAGLDVEVIPAKVQVRGDLDLNPAFGFVNLGIFVRFAVGLPLAQTGLGVFGFAGRFVSNGTRNILSTSPDPIQREIDWWRQFSQKYRPLPGQWALGVGAFVGTLPDLAFTFGALGMLVVEFPQPTVIFAIDAKFASPPAGGAQENGGATGNFLGLIAIDSTAVKIGIRGEYVIPKLLELKVPVSAYFPFDRSQGWYLRIGSDGVESEGRYGDPVTVRILPDLLDLKAWTYLMIEEKKLHYLGGHPDFKFDGFSIGWGAGAGVKWTAGPIELSASIKILVGLGVKPLMVVGGIFVEGRLHLVVVSISARGSLILTLTESLTRLKGEFCGKVDLLFFSIEGCVGFSIGPGHDPDIPEPASPLTGIDLTDRYGRITGRAVRVSPAAPPDSSGPALPSTVWPDTVPVLQFRQYMNPDLSGSAFRPVPSTGIPTPHKWAGTSELKYAFKLTGVELRPRGGAPLTGPLDAAWWLPTHRSGVMPPAGSGTPPTPAGEQEGRQLALLSWHPAPWAANLPDGGAGTEADPAEQVGRICEPAPGPEPACVLGQDARLDGPGRPTLIQTRPAPGPFPSHFQVRGREGPAGYGPDLLAALAAESGAAYIPGAVRPLPGPFSFPDGMRVDGMWEIGRFDQHGRPQQALPFQGSLAPELHRGQVTLALLPGGQPAKEVCQHYGELKLAPDQYAFRIGDVDYTSLNKRAPELRDVFGTGTPQLVVSPHGIEVNPGVLVSRVSVEVAPLSGRPVVVRAYDAAGALVAEVSSTDKQVLQTLVVTALAIDRVVVTQSGEGFALNRFCYAAATGPTPDRQPVLTHIVRAQTKLPEVVGVLPDGQEVPWKPDTEPSPPPGCLIITYHSPGEGPWVAFRIRPAQGLRMGVVRVCGITAAARAVYEDEEQTRRDLQDAVTGHTGTNAPAGRPLLEADTEYEIVVRYKWAGWRKTEDQPAPPAVTSVDWASRPEKTEVYRFRTAAWAAPTADPVDFYGEEKFDARMLARYILRFEPDGTGAPHLLGDPIRVHWAVDYPDGLLRKYGRRLVMRLRRTDQQPGALAGRDHPPDEPFLLDWSKLHLPDMPLSDQRIRLEAAAAPCLDDPHLGGSTASIVAPLAPRAEYDLLVLAQSEADPDDEVLIAVHHFRTSAYRTPAALLASVGLSTDLAQPALVPPLDVLLAADAALPSVPAGPWPASDALFEEALAGLGLDPWPLPRAGRTVALWQQSGGSWRLAGLLVETDEPLHRADRLVIGSARAGAVTLTPVVANAATTRVLFRATAPATVSDGTILRFDFQETRLRTGPEDPAPAPLSAALRLKGGPQILAQEGLL